MACKYLDFLLTRGLVALSDDGTYHATRKGLEFLELYRKLKDLLGEEQVVEPSARA